MFLQSLRFFLKCLKRLHVSVLWRAAQRDLMQIHCINPRDYAEGNYKRVDERPFGVAPVW